MCKVPLQYQNVSINLIRVVFTYILVISIGLFASKAAAVQSVDIGIFYTRQAVEHTALAQLHQLIQFRTNIANNALKTAGIALERRVATFDPSPIEQRSIGNVQKFLEDPDADAAFRQYIERFGLDYVTLVTYLPNLQTCGQAQVGGNMSVISVGERCNGPFKHYLLAHEWGHLDGAAHSLKDSHKAKLNFGVGYVCNGYSTIMNMDTRSQFKRPFYSQTGVCGKGDVADVVRMIKQRMEQADAIQNTQAQMPIYAAVGLEINHRVVSEIGGTIKGRVRISQPLEQKVSVQLFTEDITTERDFEPLFIRLVFEPGQTQVAFEVRLIDDDTFEGDEQMRIGIRYPERLQIVKREVIVTIVSDDGP